MMRLAEQSIASERMSGVHCCQYQLDLSIKEHLLKKQREKQWERELKVKLLKSVLIYDYNNWLLGCPTENIQHFYKKLQQAVLM